MHTNRCLAGCFSDPISAEETLEQIAAQSNLPLIPRLLTNRRVICEIWPNMHCSQSKRTCLL